LLKNKILSWIKKEIINELHNPTIEVWLFGSIAIDSQIPNDCDILIIYDKRFMDYIVTKSVLWQQRFIKDFNFPLHLTRLTLDEAEEFSSFVASLTKHRCT